MQKVDFRVSLRAVIGAIALIAACGSQVRAEPITIISGTALKVHVVGSLSSATASAGQTFQIAAAQPFMVQGLTVAQEGAVGQGHVVAATVAGKSGKQGSISVQLDWIYAVDGQQLPLTATTRSAAGANKTGTANAANIAAALVFGPVGLFAHNFVKGKDVVVNSDFIFPAYVSSDRTVNVLQAGRY